MGLKEMVLGKLVSMQTRDNYWQLPSREAPLGRPATLDLRYLAKILCAHLAIQTATLAPHLVKLSCLAARRSQRPLRACQKQFGLDFGHKKY